MFSKNPPAQAQDVKNLTPSIFRAICRFDKILGLIKYKVKWGVETLKVLVSMMPCNYPTTEIAISLEIINKHINAGDEVHIIRCAGTLPVCEEKALCSFCMQILLISHF